MSDLLNLQRVPERARPENAELPYLLINPPLTDPTCPYHSISYLVGSCAAYGFTGYRCLDANIEALNHLARPDSVAALLDQARRVRESMGSARPTRADELAYRAALSGIGLSPGFMQRAIEVFRSAAEFYDYPAYRDAAMAAHRFVNLLSLRSLPGAFSGYAMRMHGPVNYLSHTDLGDPDVVDGLVGAFGDYIDGPFRRVLAERDWRLIGISVNYSSQLPFALRMARAARAACPGARIVFGGTEVCDEVKYARDAAALWDVYADADIIVPGEGETPLVEILCAIRDGRGFDGLTGVMPRGSAAGRARLNYEHVGALPAPRYDIWDWAAYWSPEPVVLYSPTRGCYWNKCTFCDYGLNTDRPTSPSRERPVATVLQDLAQISAFAKTVYFSVDAMSPRYLRSLAESMAAADLGLSWSAELRLERTFPRRGIGALLRRAGCVSIAFGYESGSQRILDLIDKGVTIALVPEILRHLLDAGIGAQMMAFTGFPSETPEEARETFEFLIRHGDLWALAGVGDFSLTPGSIVARQPERFGIDVMPLPESHDIARVLGWTDARTGTQHWPGLDEDPIDPALRAQIRRPVIGRPFVGGVDASHSLLYFKRHGRTLLPAAAQAGRGGPAPIAPEQLVVVPFANPGEFCSGTDLATAHAESVRGRGRVGFAEMAAWLGQPGGARPGSSIALVTAGGNLRALDGAPAGTPSHRVVDCLNALRGAAAAGRAGAGGPAEAGRPAAAPSPAGRR